MRGSSSCRASHSRSIAAARLALRSCRCVCRAQASSARGVPPRCGCRSLAQIPRLAAPTTHEQEAQTASYVVVVVRVVVSSRRLIHSPFSKYRRRLNRSLTVQIPSAFTCAHALLSPVSAAVMDMCSKQRDVVELGLRSLDSSASHSLTHESICHRACRGQLEQCRARSQVAPSED